MSSVEFIPPVLDVCISITAASVVSHDFKFWFLIQTASDSECPSLRGWDFSVTDQEQSSPLSKFLQI